MVTATTKRVRLTTPGCQSNELGSAERALISGPYGNPLKDPIGPNNGQGSMWPPLAGLLGMEGIWLSVHNCAVGSTSLIESHVGGGRAWSNGMVVAKGSYAFNNGNVYKCNLTPSEIGTCTVAPTVAANTTGVDNIPWLYLGPVGLDDIDGVVYTQGSPRFDPNGYLAISAAGLVVPGFNEYISYASIGQGDKTVSTSRSRYAKGLQATAEYMLAHGSQKHFVGFTCCGTSPGLAAHFNDQLIPGWYDALYAMRNTPGVFRGANLTEELGVLPSVATGSTTPGMLNDFNVHMNVEAMKAAAYRVKLALNAGGV